MSHLSIPKTYKLFIGGAFPRSESGRTYAVNSADGVFLAHAAQASRKDARDAVSAARAAFSGWSGATGYNRGQVLYRIAELLDGRRSQFTSDIMSVSGVARSVAEAEVDAAIDLWVWYAGWADKYAQVAGNANPVSGPFFNMSTPEPMGVVALIAPQGVDSSLSGLVGVIAPALVTGNTVVVVASEHAPLVAVTVAEVLATSDVPAGVVNILTGNPKEMLPWLASHADVNGLDLAGAELCDPVDAQMAAAETMKRVQLPSSAASEPSVQKISAWTETKTVWHPKSLI